MKIFLTVIGVAFIALAIMDVGSTVQDGAFKHNFYFATVKQVWVRYFPSGMHLTRVFLDANLPHFSVKSLDWVGRQTAYVFFSIAGMMIIFFAWLPRRERY